MNVSLLHRCCRPLQYTLYLTTIICLISTQDKTFTLIKTCTIQKPVLFFFIELQTGKKVSQSRKSHASKGATPSFTQHENVLTASTKKMLHRFQQGGSTHTPLKNTFGMSSWLETDWVVERRGEKSQEKKKASHTHRASPGLCRMKKNKTKPTLLNIHIS